MILLIILDVILSFDDARDAVTFIIAARFPLNIIPEWKKRPMIKLEAKGTCSDRTAALLENGYYDVRYVHPSNSRLAPHRQCLKFAKLWILTALKCGIDNCNETKFFKDHHVSKYISPQCNASDPLIYLVAKTYSNPGALERIAYYYKPDNGNYFAAGQSRWVPITFKNMLDEMSRHMVEVIERACTEIVCYPADNPTWAEKLSTIKVTITGMCEQWPTRVVSDAGYAPHANAVKNLLRFSGQLLEKHRAFD